MSWIAEWLLQTWYVVLEAGPWLVGGFFIAGLIHAWVRTDRIAAHLGGSNASSVFKAALFGAPLPLCSCSVIPVAASLRKQGASRGATTAFLISTPETGVDSISLTYAMLGPIMAVLRPLAAVLSAVFAGLLVNRLHREPGTPVGDLAVEAPPDAANCHTQAKPRPAVVAAAASCPHCCADSAAKPPPQAEPHKTLVGRLVSALRYGYVDMFKDLAVWLVLGFFLAGLVSAAIPEGFFERYLGSRWLAMLAVIAVALPMYVCATSTTPVAAALVAKGMSPGTALVFLLVGPASNMATMVVVARDLGRKAMAAYLSSIVVVAVGFGLLVDLLIPAGLVRAAVHVHEHAHGGTAWWQYLLVAVFIALLVNGLRLRYLPPRKPAGESSHAPVPVTGA